MTDQEQIAELRQIVASGEIRVVGSTEQMEMALRTNDNLREQIAALQAQLDGVREAWWSGAENGDHGVIYTDEVERAMDRIWHALASAPSDVLATHDRDKDEQIAALEAQLDGVRGWFASSPDTSTYDDLARILASAPSDVLDRVKREAAAQALEEWAAEMVEWYPEDVWRPLVDKEQMAVNDALAGRTKGTTVTRDRISADMMRRAAGLTRARAKEIRSEATK